MTHLGDRIAAFVDGQLPPDERRVAQSHVAACDECRRKVREQQLLKSRVTSIREIHAPEHLLASLSDLGRIASVSEPHPARSRLSRCLHSTTLRTVVAVTGASVAVTALAYAVGAPPKPEREVVSPPVESFAADFAASAPTAPFADDWTPVPAVDLAADGAEPVFVVDSNRRIVGADDPEALRLLRDGIGASPYLDQLMRNYRISTGTTSRIDGRVAVEVRASHAGMVAAVFWIDAASGRLLRRLRYGEDGRVVESRDYAAETSIDGATDTGVAPQHAEPIRDKTLQALDRSGWPCHDLLGRGMGRVRGHWVDIGDRRAVRLTYSDGLTRLAVYEQRGTLDESGLDGFTPRRVRGATVWVRSGAPSIAVWSARGVVYTVVTDAGKDRLRAAVSELPHERPVEIGPLDRVQAGVDRMGSWLAPA